MKVGHDDKAEAGDDKTPKLDAAIRGDTTSKIIRNLAVEQNNGSATEKD